MNPEDHPTKPPEVEHDVAPPPRDHDCTPSTSNIAGGSDVGSTNTSGSSAGRFLEMTISLSGGDGRLCRVAGSQRIVCAQHDDTGHFIVVTEQSARDRTRTVRLPVRSSDRDLAGILDARHRAHAFASWSALSAAAQSEHVTANKSCPVSTRTTPVPLPHRVRFDLSGDGAWMVFFPARFDVSAGRCAARSLRIGPPLISTPPHLREATASMPYRTSATSAPTSCRRRESSP